MTALDPFDRQRRIPGWRQERLEQARVAVLGRGWLGTFVVWALRSLGIGETIWIGRPRPETEGVARFIMRAPAFGSVGTILDEPFDVEYGPELAWALAGAAPDVLVSAAEDREELLLGLCWADRNRVPAVAGRASGGGWLGTESPHVAGSRSLDPAVALLVAAILVDAVRERLCPLSAGLLPPEGGLGLEEPCGSSDRHAVLLVGAGGIGVWAAVALAAALGDRLHLVFCDFDRVAPENLNRQALFTEDDARARFPKAVAALRSLARIFPAVGVAAEVSRIEAQDAARLEAIVPRPTAILSAVDNAASRLVLQQLGRELGVPVIQGGTSVFAADCFTQSVGGRLLDDQMHGALGAAAARESQENRPGGGCAVDPSYVVPGMIAGAFMAYRLGRLREGPSPPPLRWRMGDRPLVASDAGRGIDFGNLLDSGNPDVAGAGWWRRVGLAEWLARNGLGRP
jgi:molybdopterin/thiamine biosynthesis adenylyltransferase